MFKVAPQILLNEQTVFGKIFNIRSFIIQIR